jgi:hypothetical protein
MPTFVRNPRNDKAFVYSARGHAILQLPYRVAPFVLGGYGGLGVVSDVEGARQRRRRGRPLRRRPEDLHQPAWRRSASRAAGWSRREGAARSRRSSRPTRRSWRASAWCSGACDRGRPEKDLDPDKDGFLDPNDKCPKLAGVAPDGCPAIDSDNDTFLDNVDKCPYEAGVAPDGCPPPDRDKDGFLDRTTSAPTSRHRARWLPAAAGHRRRRHHRQGRHCPLVPENYNGYEDKDGCPSTSCPRRSTTTGGRSRASSSSSTRTRSRRSRSRRSTRRSRCSGPSTSIRIEVSGHTDDVGSEEANLDLSRAAPSRSSSTWSTRAIDASRIETVGYGRSKPIARASRPRRAPRTAASSSASSSSTRPAPPR